MKCETEGEGLVTFKALTSRDGALYIDGEAAEVNTLNKGSYLLPPGSYYLAGDVGLDKELKLDKLDEAQTVELCLNGHKLAYAGTQDGTNTIRCGWSGYAFSICDCDPDGGPHTIQSPVTGEAVSISGGLITEGRNQGVYCDGSIVLYGGTIAGNGTGTSTVSGGGIRANDLEMRGGAIVHNKGSYGGGASIAGKGSFTMSGGVIRHNLATRKAGGVSTASYLGDGSTVISVTAVELSGCPVIQDNVAGDDKTSSNLYLVDDCVVNVANLSTGAKIGVTTATAPSASQPVTVAAGPSGSAITTDDLAKFTSDNEKYEPKLTDGSIVLTVPHVHNWVTTLWSSDETTTGTPATPRAVPSPTTAKKMATARTSLTTTTIPTATPAAMSGTCPSGIRPPPVGTCSR